MAIGNALLDFLSAHGAGPEKRTGSIPVQYTPTDAGRNAIRHPEFAGQRGLLLPNLCTVQAVFVLILAAELLVLVYQLLQSSLPTFNWNSFASHSLLALWQVLVSAALLCAGRRTIARLPLWAGSTVSLVLLMMVSAGITVTLPSLLQGRLQVAPWIIARNQLVTAVIAGAALRYFYMQQQLRLREQTALQARIDALQARIRPHFLFNSMNSIASLIATDPDKAEQAVLDLCDLFRASLAQADGTVAVGDEIDLCRKYAAIEQLRLGDRLQLDWQVEALPPTATIPLLSLQPLLENAIYHGIQPRPQGGCVRIEAHVDAQQCRILVSNPLPGTATPKTDGNRIAINNIRDRLHAIYGPAASLDLRINGQQFVATLTIPLVTTPTVPLEAN